MLTASPKLKVYDLYIVSAAAMVGPPALLAGPLLEIPLICQKDMAKRQTHGNRPIESQNEYVFAKSMYSLTVIVGLLYNSRFCCHR
jgi:hypothetical protein